LKYAQDDDGTWRQWPSVCRDASKIATSVTANYTTADYGYPCPETSGWTYIKKLGHDDNLPECMLPSVSGGSSSTLTRDGCSADKAGTTGNRQCRSFGYLSTALARGGLSCVIGTEGLTTVNWYVGGRLSVTGNRGTYR
jgi:hypothetical protein